MPLNRPAARRCRHAFGLSLNVTITFSDPFEVASTLISLIRTSLTSGVRCLTLREASRLRHRAGTCTELAWRTARRSQQRRRPVSLSAAPFTIWRIASMGSVGTQTTRPSWRKKETNEFPWQANNGLGDSRQPGLCGDNHSLAVRGSCLRNVVGPVSPLGHAVSCSDCSGCRAESAAETRQQEAGQFAPGASALARPLLGRRAQLGACLLEWLAARSWDGCSQD